MASLFEPLKNVSTFLGEEVWKGIFYTLSPVKMLTIVDSPFNIQTTKYLTKKLNLKFMVILIIFWIHI